jgi:hypothetical protein
MAFTRREAYDLIDILAPDLDECSRTRFVDEFTAAADVPSVYRVAEGDYSEVDSSQEPVDPSCHSQR